MRILGAVAKSGKLAAAALSTLLTGFVVAGGVVAVPYVMRSSPVQDYSLTALEPAAHRTLVLHGIDGQPFARRGGCVAEQVSLGEVPPHVIDVAVDGRPPLLLPFWGRSDRARARGLGQPCGRTGRPRREYPRAAAKRYFDVPVAALSIPQAAYLVALLKAPTALNRDPEVAKTRVEAVFDAMIDNGKLDTEQRTRFFPVLPMWVGNDDSKPMKRVTGGSLPAEIWGRFMRNAIQRDDFNNSGKVAAFDAKPRKRKVKFVKAKTGFLLDPGNANTKKQKQQKARMRKRKKAKKR